MKDFEFAQRKNNKKRFRIPRIKTKNYDIVIWELPIAPFAIAYNEISKWRDKRIVWSEAKAKKALDYFLPHVLEYVKDEDAYYYSTDWRYTDWDIAKVVPLSMKKWVKKFRHSILQYLEEGYEKEGFTKTIEKDYENYYESWIKFEKKA